MKPRSHSPSPHHSPTMIQLGRRVMVVLGLICLLVAGIWMWISFNVLKNQQMQRMGVAAGLVAGHAQNYFDYLDSHLELLAEQLVNAKVFDHPDEGLKILARFKAKHPDLGGASVILPDGQFLISTAYRGDQSLPNLMSESAWREDFQNNLREDGLSVNRPQFGFLLKKWLIPLRYTVRDEHKQVSFIIQTSIQLDRQQNLWRNLALQPSVSLGLMREDGYVLSRVPAENSGQIYGKRQQGALFKSVQTYPTAGFFDGIVGDGSDRVGAYQRLPRTPIYAFISMPYEGIWAGWWKLVQLPFYLILGSLLAGIGLYVINARQFASRMRMIQSRLGAADGTDAIELPASGVGEIDDLCGALAESQNRLKEAALNRERQLLSAAQAGTYSVRLRDGIVTTADRAFLSMLGKSEKEVVGFPWVDLFFDPIKRDGSETGRFASQDLIYRVLCFKHASGQRIWLSLAEYLEEGGAEPLRQGLAIDVSGREKLLSKVQNQSERLRTLWELATNRLKGEQEKIEMMLRHGLEILGMDAVIVNDVSNGQVTVRYAYDKEGLFQVGQQFRLDDSICKEVMKARGSFLIPNLAADPLLSQHPMSAQFGVKAYASVPIWVGEIIYGTLVYLKRHKIPESLGQDDQTFMELLASWLGQIFFQQKQRQILEDMAMTDSLTKLPNRRAAELRFAEEMARAKRDGVEFAIAICDLDRFKLINDHYGHDAGDEVLQQVAIAMRTEMREGDWMARWGGEEFIVFLHHSNTNEAYLAMERLRQAVKSKPVPTRQGMLEITTSIGIGVLRLGEEELSRVLAEADGCLYEAKRQGRDRVVVSEVTKHTTLWKAGMLHRALAENRILSAYQIMVDLQKNEVVADEALARLIQPDGSIIPAGDFIEAAEGINLVHTVDETMTAKAIQRCAERLKNGNHPRLNHFINLSPQFLARREMVRNLLHMAQDFLGKDDGSGSMIKPVVFEITERQLVSNFNELMKDLQPLLDYGFRLALDDFGSGYSSFLYMAELPISFLKIEGWMVRNMRNNHRVFSMIKSIVMLAQTLGITTIAECIEDAETANILRDMGVNWGQGYYFGAPELEIIDEKEAAAS